MTTYYISTSGNDSNAGTSSSTPWKTVAKVNAFTFKAGDVVLFERDGFWYETLSLSGDRTAPSKPVTIGNYGVGKLPKISQHKFAKAGQWVNAGSNIWTLGLKSTANFIGNQAIDDQSANVGHLRVDGVIYGSKKFSTGELAAQWDFHSDMSTGILSVYSTFDPSPYSVAIAVGQRLIGPCYGVRISGIDFVGCAGHGFGDPARDLEITGCWIHEIGGGHLVSAGATTRYGNGVQAGYSSKRVDVHHNAIFDCYDTATTNQGNSAGTALSGWEDVTYRNNLIFRCEQAFEAYSLDNEGSGATATVTVSAGAITAFAVVSGGADYTPGSTVHITGATSGATDALGVVTESSGVVTSIAVASGGTGYTNGETVTLTPIVWSEDSTKGYINNAFRDNICFDIGYGWSHDVRPDQNVASPLLVYSMDAGTVDVKIFGNKFARFRGPLITSGSGDTVASLVSKGYAVYSNFIQGTESQKLCNLLTSTLETYSGWPAESGFKGGDQVHLSTSRTRADLKTAIELLADAEAETAAANNLQDQAIMNIAGDVAKLFGMVDALEVPPRSGTSDPTIAADFIGEIYINTANLSLHYAISTSGGASSWRRIVEVHVQSGAPNVAPTFIGRILVDTGVGNAYIATGTASADDWKLISLYKVIPPTLSTSFGRTGQYAFDASYFYICTGPSTWKRVAIATW